jgi:hypothetical protein
MGSESWNSRAKRAKRQKSAFFILPSPHYAPENLKNPEKLACLRFFPVI